MPDVTWQIPEDFQGIISYNPRHDIQDYLNLKNQNGKIDPRQYIEEQIRIDNRTRRQLEKAIGERFGVEKSTWDYFVEGEVLKSPDYTEPVLKRYKKGQRFLAENGSVETAREDAEVRGITAVERIFSQHELHANQKLVIASPRGPEGTLYEENYFDVYKEREDGSIEVTRYHSTHSYEGFHKAAQKADPTFKSPPENKPLDAAHFLDKPIITSLSEDEILELFAIDTEAQSYRESQEIIAVCTPIITAYINTLAEDPLAIDQIKKTINTIFNKADWAKQQIDESEKPDNQQRSIPRLRAGLCQAGPELRPALYPSVKPDLHPIAVMREIDHYGSQPVRPSTRGCPGVQRGFTVNQPAKLRAAARLISAKSVADYARLAKNTLDDEDEDTSDFPCGGTKENGEPCTYIVRYGSGTTKCPDCGRPAVCA